MLGQFPSITPGDRCEAVEKIYSFLSPIFPRAGVRRAFHRNKDVRFAAVDSLA